MNTVALPASASSPALNAESDLIRQAARGDAEAFSELYRRHSQTAWRMAQAVAADRDSAVEAMREGFTRALKSQRRPKSTAGDAFRPMVLSFIYRYAAERLHDRPGTPVATSGRAKSAGAALAEAAFRSLPERWRAAVWLSEVESMEPARIAQVLGVSSAVATQLVSRGRRGLAGRFAQARQDAPEHLGPALRAFAIAVPANLADVCEARWSAAGSERTSFVAPVTGWLEERAVRPLWVSVGCMLGLGLIGIGLVGQGSAVRGVAGAGGASNPAGSVPVATCYGLPCPGGVTAAAAGFNLPAGGGAGGPISANAAAGSAAGSPGAGLIGGGLASSAPASSTGGSGPTPPPSPPPSNSGTPIVSVGPVTASSSGGSYTVKAGSTLSVTVLCSAGAGLTVGGTTVGCSAPSSGSTGGTSSPISTVTNTVSGATQPVTNTVTNTSTTTLVPGL